MQTIASYLLVAATSVLSLGCASRGSETGPAAEWPVVGSMDTTISIDAPNKKVLVRLPITDQRHRLAYTLACRGGDEPDVADGAPDSLWIAGVFACRMNAGAEDSDNTILVRDESPYWFTEGHVRYSDIISPEKRRRVFRLRGFELVLAFEHVTLGRTSGPEEVRPERFDLHVTLRPDARITTEWMEGTDVRMCRNWTDSTRLGSWDACSVQ